MRARGTTVAVKPQGETRLRGLPQQREDSGGKLQRMRTLAPSVAIALVVSLLYVWVPGVRERPWTPVRVLGAVLGVSGYLLLSLARWQLGTSFSVQPQAKELVTHGLYSRFRHPMYLFGDMMLCGLILVFEVPWLFVALAGLVVAQALQARREAGVLEQKFGEAYRSYRRRTWF